MVRLILGGILFLVAMASMGAAKTASTKVEPGKAISRASAHRAGGRVLLLVSVILMVLPFFHVVPVGHTGVVTVFGRTETRTLDSGLHILPPWKSVVQMDNRVQRKTEELSCFSADLQEVSVRYTLNYRISKANAMTLYSTVGKNYDDTVIDPAVSEAVKEGTAKYTVEELIGQRPELAAMIEDILSGSLRAYNIELVSTSVENMDFTDEFTDAVENKQVAQQDKIRAEIESEKRKIEADADKAVRETAADAEAYEIRAKADAEAEANGKIAASLTPDLVDYMYAQNWNGELPKVTGSGSTILNAGDWLHEEGQ